MPEKELYALASEDNNGISELESDRSVLLHGKAGAVILKKKFGIRDEEILNAVRWHTSGRPDMSGLEKIVYMADFLEPGRKYHEMVRYILEMNDPSPDNMLKEVLRLRRDHLLQKGKKIAPESEALIMKLGLSEPCDG